MILLQFENEFFINKYYDNMKENDFFLIRQRDIDKFRIPSHYSGKQNKKVLLPDSEPKFFDGIGFHGVNL